MATDKAENSVLRGKDEPEVIQHFRRQAASNNGSMIVGSCKGLGVRGELMCVNSSGEKVYRLTNVQVKKVLRMWDEAMADV
jgi:hypothetical protein